MAKILFINPNKWGRGITTIWIASHTATLRKKGHVVELFDATFYSKWTENEIDFNTYNNQYKKTDYKNFIKYKTSDIFKDLQNKINNFKPDIIFWSAISSHIHGEGEYVNIEYGYNLIDRLNIQKSLLVTAGLQATALPELIIKKFPKIDYLISGESEFILEDIASNVNNKKIIETFNGVSYLKGNQVVKNPSQKIIKKLDDIPNYDYSIFDDMSFYRAYNGKVVRALDYEMSRGCIYTCSYCVETVIQKYYGFKKTSSRGALVDGKKYVRSKSASRIYEELESYKRNYNIDLVRCQDTNFLTLGSDILKNLENLFLKKKLDIKLYIETRPEGINPTTIRILKNLGVDGIGMGIELSGEEFREESLNRFSNQSKIIEAFKLLKENGIKRTAYNIIGLPNQNEDSIKSTIEFNKLLKPDNVTVAFYSPYLGTKEQEKSLALNYFSNHENRVDGQLRSLSKDTLLKKDILYFYKKNFNNLIFDRK